MKPEIKEVKTKKEIKAFIQVPFSIYKGNPYWVPPLIQDEMDTFDKEINPAYEHADARLFIAYHGNKAVGRIAAIFSFAANEKYKTKNIRFGWFDTIDDYDVAEALLQTVEKWGRELGMETITGPHGFCDFDSEGMIVDGFETIPTIVCLYNASYYPVFTEKYGFTKDVDYFEFRTQVPHNEGIPEKLLHLSERIKERTNIHLLEFKNNKEVLARGKEIFELIDEAFEEIYGTTPLTQRQIDYYVKKYISYLNKEMIKVAVNEADEVVGFMFTLPSLSKAFQKAKGKLLPFGWFHLLKAMYTHDVLDFYLAGIKKKYQGKGIDLMLAIEIVKMALEKGFNCAESNLELEHNTKVQAMWKYFNPVRNRIRRIYKKEIPK